MLKLIGAGCYRVEPVFIEDDDKAWDQVLNYLDRWGDRKVPREASTISVLWSSVEPR